MQQSRREVTFGLVGLALTTLPVGAAHAGVLDKAGILQMLSGASDRALDRLSQPNAFYDDPAIRIALPLLGNTSGSAGTLGRLLGVGGQLGLTDGITRKLNDAAGIAAREAKPLFRKAVQNLSITDLPAIVAQNDGATQYLRRSAGADVTAKLRPLIDAALGQVGAMKEIDSLARRGASLGLGNITRRTLSQSVADQAANGIFRYIGDEESKVRADPAGAAGSVLKGLLGN